MALTESQIEALGDKYLVGLYQEMERDVIQDIARRVRKTDRWTETAEIMARNMKEMGYSTSKIYSEVMRVLQADPEYITQVAENTKEYKAMVTEIIKETTAEARAAGNELVAQAGMMAYNNDLSMWEQAGQDLSEPNQLSQIVSSFQKDLDGELRNLTRTTGFKGTILGTTGVKQAYQRALDVSMLEVASGNFSYDAAVDRVVKQLAQSGLRKIDYASGRSYQLDTAARMCVRTSVNQMAGRITEANAQSTDTDLVIVTEHEGARPEHVPCERQVYSLSGKSKKYPDFRAALGKGAGYGTAEGICGPNCRHTFYPFWPGISKIPDPLPKHDPFKYKGKTYDYYEATQKQRSMERQIRSLKREEYVARTDEDRAAIQRQIRAKTKEYHDFSDAAGIRPKDNRLRVVGSTVERSTPAAAMKRNANTVWGGTATSHSKKELERLAEYAMQNKITIDTSFASFDGDIDLVKDFIAALNDNVHQRDHMRKKRVSLSLSYSMNDDDYAVSNGSNITINGFAFRDRELLRADYESRVDAGWFTKGSTYLDIAAHESAHMIVYLDQLKYRGTAKKVFGDNKVRADLEICDKISEYASANDQELIAESYVAYKNGSNEECVLKVLKFCGIL